LRSTERAGLTSELDIGEQDVDDDGDDDHGNNIGESDMVEGDEVSAAHSCKCKASCIRMFDSDDVKDHSVKVQVLKKRARSMYIMGRLQRIGDRETRKGKSKITQICAQRSLRLS